MKSKHIDWDAVPEILSKDQLYKLCRISPATARFLLVSGKIPCCHSGKKTRCYRIRKQDVQVYLQERERFPEYYKADPEWYATGVYDGSKPPEPPLDLDGLHDYYTELLCDQPDVFSADTAHKLTGYHIDRFYRWCKQDKLQHFKISGKYQIPKVYLIDFFCSKSFRSIPHKSPWHTKTLAHYQTWYY